MRGIELTLIAIVIGIFFLKFDLITTIIGHMTFNATLGMLPLLRSGEPYFVFSGIVVALALVSPILPGLWRFLKRRWLGESLETPQIGAARLDDCWGMETKT